MSLALAAVADRGYRVHYRSGEANRCPGCGRSHWHVGRSSAECASCGTTLLFASASTGLHAGCSPLSAPVQPKDD